MLLKHRHAVLIRDLNGLYPYLSRATCSLIATNIGDLVIDNRAARLESGTLWRRNEVDTLIGAAYGSLLNLFRCTDLTVWTTPLWPALARAPKYWQLAELQDQLD